MTFVMPVKVFGMTDFESSIKAFWDAQAKKAEKLKPEAISNLEEDPILIEKKILIETKKVFSYANLSSDSLVLDLGSGTGQWAFRFANIVKHVTAVEFSSPMLNIAEKLAIQKNIKNVSFHSGKAQTFNPKSSFDLVFISGLLIYLTDNQISELLKNVYGYLKLGGRVILRDGTALNERYEIHNKYSDELDANYTAFYRTTNEYIAVFKSHGLDVLKHEDMFEAGSELNKRIETRLRIYEFKKTF